VRSFSSIDFGGVKSGRRVLTYKPPPTRVDRCVMFRVYMYIERTRLIHTSVVATVRVVVVTETQADTIQ